MRNWQADAPHMIAAIHSDMPDASPADLRKALRLHSSDFSMGTSWGKKVWAKHCKIYLARMAGGSMPNPKTQWPADIAFPFKEKRDA
jgi:hypothetical protein